MFSKLLGQVRKQRKLHSWRRSAVGHAIKQHLRSTNKNWMHFQKEEKEQLASEFYARIFAVLDSTNALLECRKELVTNVIKYTDLQALCLTTDDKTTNPIFKDMNRVSSDLRDHIYKCTLYNEELDKYVKENIYDETELINFIIKKCEVYCHYAYGFDIARKSIESDGGGDLFPRLVQSSIIISESNYRKYLGLPQIVTAIDSSLHSNFINMVLNGESDPLLTWERRFGKSHGATI
jgi:hypothetical protein